MMLEILSLLSPGAVAMLFAFLVSRCQRGRESRNLCRCPVVSLWFVVSFLSSFALFGFVPVRPGFSSYGVRHMLPYPLLSMSITYFGNL